MGLSTNSRPRLAGDDVERNLGTSWYSCSKAWGQILEETANCCLAFPSGRSSPVAVPPAFATIMDGTGSGSQIGSYGRKDFGMGQSGALKGFVRSAQTPMESGVCEKRPWLSSWLQAYVEGESGTLGTPLQR